MENIGLFLFHLKMFVDNQSVKSQIISILTGAIKSGLQIFVLQIELMKISSKTGR
jgi:hypothetical protein